MRVAIACDHAGYELKVHVKKHVQDLGHEVRDFGTNSTESVDFVDFVYPAAKAVSEGMVDRAILIDGAGYSSGIVANLLPDVYAAVANDPLSARFSREHSDTNVLCLGGKLIGAAMAADIVTVWLNASFLGGRYTPRVQKVRELARKHRRSADEQPRKVVTEQDLRDAIRHRQSLLIDSATIFTPSVLDLLR
jgi:ribose 5-phosphate isomerase B